VVEGEKESITMTITITIIAKRNPLDKGALSQVNKRWAE
jgi:hypothetical protein